MRGLAGGFATGLQAGSQAAARAYQAQIDQENQEHLQTQREEERQTKAQLAAAAAPAQTTEGQGLMVQGPDGRAFYIPADATDAASAYTRAGYNVAEAPTRYSEVTAGGKTLRQAEISPEHAELGYNPLTGLQQQYDAQRMQRLKDVGMARGRPELAAAYGNLGVQELQQKKLQGDIEMQPLERAGKEVVIAAGREEVAAKKRANEVAVREDQWWQAAKSEDATIKHYNDNFKDGSTAKVVEKNGMRQMVQVREDGTQVPLGAPYKSWAEGGRTQILGNVDSLAKEQLKLDLQHRNKLEEIKAQGAEHARYAGILAGNKKVQMTPDQKARFSAIDQEIVDAGDDQAKLRTANMKLGVLNNQVAMANGMLPKPLAIPQERQPGRSYTADDQHKFQQARKDFLEVAPQLYPDWGKMSQATKEQIMRDQGLWSLGGGGAAGGADRYTAGSGVAANQGGSNRDTAASTSTSTSPRRSPPAGSAAARVAPARQAAFEAEAAAAAERRRRWAAQLGAPPAAPAAPFAAEPAGGLGPAFYVPRD